MTRATNIEISQAIFQQIKDPSLRHKLLDELVKGGGGITIVGSTGSAASAGGGAPASGPDAATKLAIALGDLDIHEDGDVITADSYNAIVEVLRALAGFAAGGAVASTLDVSGVETFAPLLLGIFGQNIAAPIPVPWELGPDFASAEDDAFGWMPATLPDDVLIDRLTVVNERDINATLEVELRRLSLEDPTDPGVVLCTVKRGKADAGEVRPDSEPVRVRGISTTAALDELRRVDNSSFRYVIEAKALSARVRIFALQVSWER